MPEDAAGERRLKGPLFGETDVESLCHLTDDYGTSDRCERAHGAFDCYL